MSNSEQACRRAVMASQEVVMENCEDVEGSVEEVGDNVFVFVSEDARQSFMADMDDSLSGREREDAIESCMATDFADEYADVVLGEDVSEAAREAARRSVCERLFS